MRRQGKTKKGFTLVEMLVVMAIIVIMSAIAIPTLVRSGALSRDEMGASARTLLNMLRAGRVYSATFRTDTAVVYFLKQVPDSRDNTSQVVVDAIALARCATPAELQTFSLGPEKKVFFLVGGNEGGIVSLERGSCIQARVENLLDNSTQDQLLGRLPTNLMRQGVYPVRLFTLTPGSGGTPPSVTEVSPRAGLESLSWGWINFPLKQYFPAHVFRPNGELRTERDETPGRLELRINYTPDTRVEDRFIAPNKEVAGVRIELNRFTGKARIVEEEAG